MSDELRVATGRPVVIDSSVVFKWFDTSEDGSEEAGKLLEAHARDEIALVVPAHVPLEIMNVHVSRGATVERMREAVAALAAVDLLVAPVDEDMLIDAARISFDERMALYDSIFIALAARLDAELVTADRRQAGTTACKVTLLG